MSLKEWLEEMVSAGTSMLRGLTFPLGPGPGIASKQDVGTVALAAALSGALYGAVINGMGGTDIPLIDASALGVLSVAVLLFLFWLFSKAFLKVTNSARSLVLNLVENQIALWMFFLAIMFLFGLMGFSPYSNAISGSYLINQIKMIWISMLLCTPTMIVFWFVRHLLKLLDPDYFDDKVQFLSDMKMKLIILQFFSLTIMSYLLFAIPLWLFLG
ncbi:MAG: hypothetical protein ABJM29_04330 [Rhizobiaceae bacterium]